MVLGLYAAGKAAPHVVLTGTILYELDSTMEKDALDSIRNANKEPGRHSPIVALEYKPFQSKNELELAVSKNGGTAWIQSGSNRRLGAYWHPLKSFTPQSNDKTALGHVIHGASDSSYLK